MPLQMQRLASLLPAIIILASFPMESLSLGRLCFRLNQAAIVFVAAYQYHYFSVPVLAYLKMTIYFCLLSGGSSISPSYHASTTTSPPTSTIL